MTGQQASFPVLKGDGIFGQNLGGDAIPQQPFHAVLGHDDPVEPALVIAQWGVQLQHVHGRVAVGFYGDLPINGLHQVPG